MKKLLSLLLAVILLATGLSFALAEQVKEGIMYTTGLPIVDKDTYSFSILVDDSGMVEDKYMLPILEEQTNVKVEWLLFPYETAREKLGILLSSGDYPDVIGGWLLGRNDILNDGMIDGLYIPLEDLFEKYAPNIMEVLEIPGVRQAFTLPDGHIYTIPYVIGEPLVTFLPWINKVWLDNLGLEVPTTTDELKEVLIAFRDNDANGNGDPNDEIPFSGDPVNLALGTYAGWFGVNASSAGNNPYYALVDGKLQFNANQPEFKEFIEYFADLYKEKLIDPELFTQDPAMWKSKGKQNLYGVCVGYGPGDFYDNNEDDTNDFTYLPVLTSPNGKTPVFRRNGYGVTFFRTQVAITDKAEHPEVIVRWFDNVFAEENSVQIQWGPLGTKLEKVDDGVYRAMDTSHFTEEEEEKWGWGNAFPQSLPKYIKTSYVLQDKDGNAHVDIKQEADAMYEPYLDEPLPLTWTVNEADAERYSILSTDINNYVKTKIAQWVTGEADVNAEWDEYLDQLEKLGLSEMNEIKQRELDSVTE
ncbi:MAG: extracellular solute-binding protein [Clostridiales bacterium]|jgi:putative aldouronate transport system substrate-binding protein|nr:extracellular solute-binding protein [Clostridiales bacterium]